MRINLQRVMHLAKLDPAEVAQQLFPNHKVPKAALGRVLKGAGQLNEEQLYKLSIMARTDVHSLYNPTGWVHSFDPDSQVHVLESKGYTAYIDIGFSRVSMYAHGGLFASEVLVDPSMALTDLIKILDSIISK